MSISQFKIYIFKFFPYNPQIMTGFFFKLFCSSVDRCDSVLLMSIVLIHASDTERFVIVNAVESYDVVVVEATLRSFSHED